MQPRPIDALRTYLSTGLPVLYNTLPPALQSRMVTSLFSVHKLAAERVLFRSGEQAGSVFVLLTGAVGLFSSAGELVATLHAGDCFGRFSLAASCAFNASQLSVAQWQTLGCPMEELQRPRPCTAVSLDDCQYAELTPAAYARLPPPPTLPIRDVPRIFDILHAPGNARSDSELDRLLSMLRPSRQFEQLSRAIKRKLARYITPCFLPFGAHIEEHALLVVIDGSLSLPGQAVLVCGDVVEDGCGLIAREPTFVAHLSLRRIRSATAEIKQHIHAYPQIMSLFGGPRSSRIGETPNPSLALASQPNAAGKRRGSIASMTPSVALAAAKPVDTLLEAMGHLKFFQMQQEKVRRAVCMKLRYQRFPKDTLICEQGFRGDRMYVILSGSVSVHVRSDEDSPRTEPSRRSSENNMWWLRARNSSASSNTHDDTPAWPERRDRRSPVDSNGKLLSESPASLRPVSNVEDVFGPCVLVCAAGNGFGEESLLGDGCRQASIITRSEVEVVYLLRDDYQELLAQSDDSTIRSVDKVISVLRRQPLQRTGAEIETLVSNLKGVSFFAELAADMRHFLMRNAIHESVDADTVLFEQGDPGEHMFILLRGSVSVYKRTSDTRRSPARTRSRRRSSKAHPRASMQTPLGMQAEEGSSMGPHTSPKEAIHSQLKAQMKARRTTFQRRQREELMFQRLRAAEDLAAVDADNNPVDTPRSNRSSLSTAKPHGHSRDVSPMRFGPLFGEPSDAQQQKRMTFDLELAHDRKIAHRRSSNTSSTRSSLRRSRGTSRRRPSVSSPVASPIAARRSLTGSARNVMEVPSQAAAEAAVQRMFEQENLDLEELYGPCLMILQTPGESIGLKSLLERDARAVTVITREKSEFLLLDLDSVLHTVRHERPKNDHDEAVKYLSHVLAVPGMRLSRTALLRMAFHVQLRELKRGDMLFKEDDPVANLFIVKSGQAVLQKHVQLCDSPSRQPRRRPHVLLPDLAHAPLVSSLSNAALSSDDPTARIPVELTILGPGELCGLVDSMQHTQLDDSSRTAARRRSSSSSSSASGTHDVHTMSCRALNDMHVFVIPAAPFFRYVPKESLRQLKALSSTRQQLHSERIREWNHASDFVRDLAAHPADTRRVPAAAAADSPPPEDSPKPRLGKLPSISRVGTSLEFGFTADVRGAKRAMQERAEEERWRAAHASLLGHLSHKHVRLHRASSRPASRAVVAQRSSWRRQPLTSSTPLLPPLMPQLRAIGASYRGRSRRRQPREDPRPRGLGASRSLALLRKHN